MFIEWLNSKGARITDGRIQSFGDTVAEYQALESAIIVSLLAHKALRVTGDDRHDFIHGQVTHEVKQLKLNTFSEALMLNHKGHALAQMRVFRRDEDLFLAIENNAGDFVERELRAHIIFDQVELQNVSNTLTSLTIQGPRAATILSSLNLDVPTGSSFIQAPFAGAKILIHSAKRSVTGGFDIHVLTKDAVMLLEHFIKAGAVLAGENALEISRIEAGIPYVYSEATEGILPQEAGLEPLVSYTKGCYLGQEIMARIEARGHMRRSLQGLKLSGHPTESEIKLENKIVGQLGAWVQHPTLGVIALAVLRNDIDPHTVLSVSGLEARIVPLPFTS